MSISTTTFPYYPLPNITITTCNNTWYHMVRLKKKQNSEHNAFILRRNTKVTLQCCHDYRKFPTTIGYLKTNVWKKDLVQETLKTYVIRKSGAAITYALLFNSTSTYIHRNLNVESTHRQYRLDTRNKERRC